jgi:maltose O-acetyltransferase
MKKTEREKMLSTELYLSSDPELLAATKRAYRILRSYNSTTEEEQLERYQILQSLFAEVGKNANIIPSFYCDYGSNIYAGDDLFMNHGCVILDCNTVHLGDNLLCGPYVQIYTAYHPTDPAIRLEGKELAAPVKIGNNVWIGGGAIICPGVTIGDNTTIGAGSVVVKDVPENVVAAGNPCRILRDLT